MTFGERLNELMSAKGVTQYRLSKDLGLSNSTIANWRGDLVRPEGDKLLLLAGYFGVSIDYLVGNTDIKNTETPKVDTSDLRWAFYEGSKELTDDDMQEMMAILELKKLRNLKKK